MKRKSIIIVALVCLLGIFTACSSNDSSTSPVGTWNLTAMDLTSGGSVVHYTSAMLSANGISITVVVKSDKTLTADGLYFGHPFSLSGTWSQSGSSFNYVLSDGTSGTASMTGNTITASGLIQGYSVTLTLTKS